MNFYRIFKNSMPQTGEICNSSTEIINSYNQSMKENYCKPDCELLELGFEGVLCYSGEGGIPDVTAGSFDDSDIEIIL